MISFGPFSLDENADRLWHGAEERPLRAKSLAVLRELLRRRGRLVTREELFRACWPKTAVSQTVLRVCISEIRTALAADVTSATAVQNVGRRGYRLVSEDADAHLSAAPPIARDRELDRLRRALARADGGLRQVVLVTGEAGLGKTTLMEYFAEETRTTSRARVGWGACAELTGGPVAYLPILDVLGHLCVEDPGGNVVAAVERLAPSWLSQLPGLIDPARAADSARRVPNTNRDRMLREFAELVEDIAAEETLVLVFEDLHWSDFASIDALAFVAQRSRPARLLVVCTYRPADIARETPLYRISQGLVANRRATVLPLAPLTCRDVEACLTKQLPDVPVAANLSRSLHARTQGNPLFVTTTVDYLLERGLLSAGDGSWDVTAPLDGVVPDGLRQLVLCRVDRLDPSERCVMDAASIDGADFTVASVAAASGLAMAVVEEVCSRLASRNELVSPTGVAAWPDDTVSGRYAFSHVVYREVIEAALPSVHVQRIHRSIAERLESAWGERNGEIAAQLALHFGAAGDRARAMRYHIAAAAGAGSRFAPREIALHLRAALEHLRYEANTTEQARVELTCLIDLGRALVVTHGPASEAALAVHRRALELAEQLGEPHVRFGMQTAICASAIMRDLRHAYDLANELLDTSARLATPRLTFFAHVSCGVVLFNQGELASARGHLDQAHEMWQADFTPSPFDAYVLTCAVLGNIALIGGDTDEGLDWLRKSVAHAESLDSPYNISNSHQLAAQFYAIAGQREPAVQHAAKAAALAAEYGFVVHEAIAAIVDGWARRDVTVLRQGIERYESAEQYLATSVFRGLLVETLLELDQIAAAHAELVTALAFVERSGERRHLAELYRLYGECVRHGFVGDEAERSDAKAWFNRALELARQQGAWLWELRAAIATASLLTSQGAQGAARAVLESCVRPLHRENDLPDLRKAHAFLAAL